MSKFNVLNADKNVLAIIEADDMVTAEAMAKDIIVGAETVAERKESGDSQASEEIAALKAELEEKEKTLERLAKASPELSSAGNAVKLFSMWLARRASTLGIGKLQPNSDRNMAYLVELFAEKMGLNLPEQAAAEDAFAEIVVKKSGMSMD